MAKMNSLQDKLNSFPNICCVLVFVSLVFTNQFVNTLDFSENVPDRDGDDREIDTSLNYFATTPKIMETTKMSRYEQGLEDYEEALGNMENEKEIVAQKPKNDFNPISAFFDLLTKAHSTSEYSSSESLDRKDQTDETITTSSLSSTTIKTTTKSINQNSSSTTDVSEGRYIKGDPLNGYYDFIITEGSYKFWATFQLATAALIIYSTFAAIYYSKVNPLTSDYDYVDYLSRSFHGRSMPEDEQPTTAQGPSWMSSIFSGKTLSTAAHTFQFVLDSIDKIPQ